MTDVQQQNDRYMKTVPKWPLLIERSFRYKMTVIQNTVIIACFGEERPK